MGEAEHLRSSERCCDTCTPHAVTKEDRLNVLERGKAVRRKKQVAVRVTSEDLSEALKQQLMAERDKYLRESIFLFCWCESCVS